MTTLYTGALTFFLLALTSDAFVIRVNNDTNPTPEELKKLLVMGLESMRTEINDSEVVAADVYGKILDGMAEFFNSKSEEIFDDLNKKRKAFYDFRKEKSNDEINNCFELVGELGRNANDAVATLNECAVRRSETVEEYFNDFDEKVAAKLNRLDAFAVAAQKCFESDDIKLIESCLQGAWNTDSHRDVLYSLAMQRLQTALDTFETTLVSCSVDRYDAYYLSSSIFIEEAQKCVRARNSQDTPTKV